MFFPDFHTSYTFSMINDTGRHLVGNNQKVFFSNVKFLNDKVIKNITIYDRTSLGIINIKFDGIDFTMFDTAKDTKRSYLYLVDKNDNIVLDRFPLNELRLAQLDPLSKQYNFNLKDIDWLRSYVIKSDIANVWGKDSGFLMQVYY